MVGAGVIGLTAAVRLLEAGHRVDVVARDLPLETTSAIAAALWYPYRALPQERVTAWAARSREVLAGLAAASRTPAYRLRRGTEVLREAAGPPWWASAVPGSRGAARAAAGVRRRPLLPRAGGGHAGAPALAERTGRGARRHPHPPQPRRRCPPAPTWWSTAPGSAPGCSPRTSRSSRCAARSSTSSRSAWRSGGSTRPGPTYVVPREREIILGGTDEEGVWSRTPDPVVAASILRRATALVPALAGARCCATGSGCVRCGPPCAWSGSGGWSTATATAAPASPSPGGCAEEVVGLVGEAVPPHLEGVTPQHVRFARDSARAQQWSVPGAVRRGTRPDGDRRRGRHDRAGQPAGRAGARPPARGAGRPSRSRCWCRRASARCTRTGARASCGSRARVR